MHHSDRNAHSAFTTEAGRRFQTLGMEAAYLARKRKREQAAELDHFLRVTAYKLVAIASTATLLWLAKDFIP